MLANNIAFSYDHDNDSQTAAISVALTRFEEGANKSVYVSDSHQEAAPDTLQFSRTLPKRAGSFLGVQRVEVKRTRSRVVKNAEGADIRVPDIQALSFAIPSGTSEAAKLNALMEWIGFLSSTEGKAALVRLLNISEI